MRLSSRTVALASDDCFCLVWSFLLCVFNCCHIAFRFYIIQWCDGGRWWYDENEKTFSKLIKLTQFRQMRHIHAKFAIYVRFVIVVSVCGVCERVMLGTHFNFLVDCSTCGNDIGTWLLFLHLVFNINRIKESKPK